MMNKVMKWMAPVVASWILAGCSGGAGESVQSQPNLSSSQNASTGPVLSGPAPRTDDIQRFRLQVWENVAGDDRCGQCHGASGQSPRFARNDDINLAYDETGPLVDLARPSQSRLVSKVAGGHNCWLASDAACGDIMTTWITNWAGESEGDSVTIELLAPPPRDPGASKTFPASAGAFATTVHPLLLQYCTDCHTDTAAIPQSPFFSVADADLAYSAARSKIDLDDPARSRLAVRLGSEFHNCWSNCTADAAEMTAAIEAFVATIPETEIAPELVTSKALTLLDGVVASGGGRTDTNAVALYQFKSMTGVTAYDTSGVEPAMNLTFDGDVNWVGGWGIRVGDGGKAQASTASSAKLYDLLTATGEYSIEAWVAPANVTQEEARIVSYSGGTQTRNFALAQTLYNYNFLARFPDTDANGSPALSTPDGDEVLQATLQHVIVTFDPSNGRQLYVNGDRIDVADPAGGTLADWDDTFAFVVGNEVSGDRLWRGIVRLVAVHNRALTPVQVRQNFDAGVGERFFLLFGIGDLIDVPDAYVVFEVSQFDDFSYLFTSPFFVVLGDGEIPDGIPVEGLRVGINGREPEVGQAWGTLATALDASAYEAGSGQVLSTIGTILGIEKGPDSDEFFLTFERLGTHENVRVEAALEPQGDPADSEPVPDIGLKTFDEINASMAAMTGVSMAHPDVRDTFVTVRQQLPSLADVEGFLSSQQMGVTQLAIEYCNALVEDPAQRRVLFPGLAFDAAPGTAFASTDALVDPLLDAVFGINVASQPERPAARAELDALVSQLAASGNDATRTRTIVKATCAATLGSAAMLIQ